MNKKAVEDGAKTQQAASVQRRKHHSYRTNAVIPPPVN